MFMLGQKIFILGLGCGTRAFNLGYGLGSPKAKSPKIVTIIEGNL